MLYNSRQPNSLRQLCENRIRRNIREINPSNFINDIATIPEFEESLFHYYRTPKQVKLPQINFHQHHQSNFTLNTTQSKFPRLKTDFSEIICQSNVSPKKRVEFHDQVLIFKNGNSKIDYIDGNSKPLTRLKRQQTLLKKLIKIEV